MGQSANTLTLQLQTKKHWSSRWFSESEYNLIMHEDLVITEYLRDTLSKHKLLFSKPIIRRQGDKINIYIKLYRYSSRIKRWIVWYKNKTKYQIKKEQMRKYRRHLRKIKLFIKNSVTSHLEQSVSTICKKKVKIAFIISTKFDSEILSQLVAKKLKKRQSLYSIFKRIKKRIEKHKRIKGVRIDCSGRPTGRPRAKSFSVQYGPIHFSTISQNLDYAHNTVWTKYGIVGIKVWISHKELCSP